MEIRQIYQEKSEDPARKYADLEELNYEVLVDRNYAPRTTSSPSPGEITTRLIYRSLYHLNDTTLEIVQYKDNVRDRIMPRGTREDNVVWRSREFNFLGKKSKIEEIVRSLEEEGIELSLIT